MRSDLRNRVNWPGSRGRREEWAEDRFGMASEEDARGVLDRFGNRLDGDLAGRGGGRELKKRVTKLLPLVQGGYYLASGIWPLVHMRSFEAVTGSKTDRWLVRTVGVLAAAIGAGLLQSSRRERPVPEMRTIARLAATGFAAVEIPNVLSGRISPIYLADAAAEGLFLASDAWVNSDNLQGEDKLDRLWASEARDLQGSLFES